jgi:hypothetical protein
MNLEERIRSFSVLGEILRDCLEDNHVSGSSCSLLHDLIENQYKLNPWFTAENVRYAIYAIATELTEENLLKWTSSYPLLNQDHDPLKVGVIMAGNIPLAGFHDFLSVLISGNTIIAKTSSKDSELIQAIVEVLVSVNPEFRNRIAFTTGTLSGFDAVIATGSNNSSRYFEYYFGKYPNIIRKNRNSIAVLTGDETDGELEALGRDIFLYFGLGCRSVSKIYIPKEYEISSLEKHWISFNDCIRHQKYANNYDFNKAVYLVNKESFYDTGYLLMKEERKLSSPVSVLYYDYYESQNALKQQIDVLKDNIQCIVGRDYIPYGMAQSPQLWEYADGIDTIEFLLKKNLAGIL